MKVKIEENAQPLDQVYCPRCYLATPTWRTWCIHCRAKLNAAANPHPHAHVETPAQRSEAA